MHSNNSMKMLNLKLNAHYMYIEISSQNAHNEMNLFSGTSYCSAKESLNAGQVKVQTQQGPPVTSLSCKKFIPY